MLPNESSWGSRSRSCCESIDVAREAERGRVEPVNRPFSVDTAPEDTDLATVACDRWEEIDDA